MRYRVKFKSTVTTWIEVDINQDAYAGLTQQDFREIAADDAVGGGDEQFHQHVNEGRVEWGPIELAHEELDESVEAIG